MKNPYISLAIRLSVVLLGVLAISKLHAQDERVLAETGAELIVASVQRNRPDETDRKDNPVLVADAGMETPEITDTPSITGELREESEVKTVDEEPDGLAGPDMSETGDRTDTGDLENTETPGTPDESDEVDTSDAAEEGTSDVEEGNGEPDITEEPDEPPKPDANDPTLYVGLNELEAAELHASLDPDYKSTAEYISALLVTHPDHYNETLVTEAHSMPLESNDARYEFLTGKGYKAYTTKDMPDGFQSESRAARNMVTFDVPVWKMSSSGKKYSSVWSITIHEKLAASVRCIFSDIYLLDIRFPFNYLKGFMYRKVGGSGLVASPLMSAHAFGSAIDINYWDSDNDYYLGKGNDLRDRSNPYCIPDEVIAIFESYGWFWGGNFDICADTMHFQYLGLEFLQYDSDEPFPILYRGAENMDATYINNLAKRLVRLGYLESETSKFTKKVDAALKAFQEEYGLEPDGIADYETWVPLINATHDMSYVF